jgi:hypothetical protein
MVPAMSAAAQHAASHRFTVRFATVSACSLSGVAQVHSAGADAAIAFAPQSPLGKILPDFWSIFFGNYSKRSASLTALRAYFSVTFPSSRRENRPGAILRVDDVTL